MKTVDERQADRFRLLKRLYDVSEAKILGMATLEDLARDTGLKMEETENIAQYLVAKSLVTWRAQQLLSPTEWGIDEVEAVLKNPQEPTANFPPLNILIAGAINNSTIQQGVVNSSQAHTISTSDRGATLALVDALKAALGLVEMSQIARADANAQLATVEAQLQSPKPKKSIIRESLTYLREIRQTAGAAAPLIEKVTTFLKTLSGS